MIIVRGFYTLKKEAKLLTLAGEKRYDRLKSANFYFLFSAAGLVVDL
jgi:hypothetical protein